MLKVAVIGGGSTYIPELIMGFLARTKTFPIDELWLMDIDEPRLDVVGGFAKRIAESHNAPFEVVLSTNQREAVKDASYVTTQLRVGHMAARREDEYLGKRYGLIGQETTGIGGMAKALRTIPVILQLARDMRELAPQALLVNFTNPSGLVTQALSLFEPDVPSVGVCNVAITAKMHMISKLEEYYGRKINPDDCELDTLGLNHLSWHRGFKVEGKQVWDDVLQGFLDELRKSDEPDYPVKLIEVLRMIPNYYLQYYYLTKHELDQQDHWPPSRAEQVIEVEKDLLREYSDPNQKDPPADLMKRGGAYYSTAAAQLLNAHYNDLGETHVVNVKHGGAIAGWPEEWVLEMPCKVDHSGIHPIKALPLPDVCYGLIAQVKAHELLTSQAAVTGDRDLLFQAMLAHPLGPDADMIEPVMEDLLQINKPYLPQFFK